MKNVTYLFLIAFVLSAQFCIAQTIDFTNVTPEEEKELFDLYKNNHLSPEKLTKEQKQKWDVCVVKEKEEVEFKAQEEYKLIVEQEKNNELKYAELIKEESMSGNTDTNINSNHIKMMSKDEAQKLEQIEQIKNKVNEYSR